MKRERAWDRFERLAALEQDACVVWPGRLDDSGYGVVTTPEGRRVGVHREALWRRSPYPGRGMVARHGPCHDRACMNYRHLSWGTESDNYADRFRDETIGPGVRVKEVNGFPITTWEGTRALRMLYSDRTPAADRSRYRRYRPTSTKVG